MAERPRRGDNIQPMCFTVVLPRQPSVIPPARLKNGSPGFSLALASALHRSQLSAQKSP